MEMSGCVGVKQPVEDTGYPACPFHLILLTQGSLSEHGAKMEPTRSRNPAISAPNPDSAGVTGVCSHLSLSHLGAEDLSPAHGCTVSAPTYLLMDLPSSLFICLTIGGGRTFHHWQLHQRKRHHMHLCSKVDLIRTMLRGFQWARKKECFDHKEGKAYRGNGES